MKIYIIPMLFSALGLLAADEPKSCIFCEIAAGKEQSRQVVYQDESTVVFMSHGPRNPGHVLIAPREHYQDLLDVPSSTLSHMAEVAQMMAKAIKISGLQAEGFNMLSNTGAAAGQTVFHLHIHIVPRFAGETRPSGKTDEAELEIVAERIRKSIETMKK